VYTISDRNDILPVLAIAYTDVPEDGDSTGFTFGLSSANHPEWINSKPELMISVRSRDHAWTICMGEIVQNSRYESTFSYGAILHFRQRVVDTCPMTSFLLFACTMLDAEQQRICLEDRVVNISQLYPIYEDEVPLILEIGVEKFFWELGIQFEELGRPPVLRN
jgi:Suppressor of fused protein (SUFU)